MQDAGEALTGVEVPYGLRKGRSTAWAADEMDDLVGHRRVRPLGKDGSAGFRIRRVPLPNRHAGTRGASGCGKCRSNPTRLTITTQSVVR